MLKQPPRSPFVALAFLIAGTPFLFGGNDGARQALASQAPQTSQPSPRPRTLGDAARHIRLRWPRHRRVLITNKNIRSFSSRGGLTTVTSPAASTVPSPGTAVAATPARTKKEYWQTRYRSHLDRIAALKKRLARLDNEIPRLWNQFYAWDDPAYRDAVIKPKLDAALAARKKVKAQLLREEKALPKFFEAARRNNVPPGWFRGLRDQSPRSSKTGASSPHH
ncbi:MAG: hypothetical protein GXP48_09505 [Acidobacteria bacterium]|nr:hypothetical protein [Acidobacteriota bacterium]